MYGTERNRGLLTAIGVALLLACTAAMAGEAAKKGTNGRHDLGEVLIFGHGTNVYVALDTFSGRGGDGTVDQWYVLQRQSSAELQLPIHFSVADVQHREGALRVTSPDSQTAYDFFVSGYVSDWPETRPLTVVATEGYGLSRNVAPTRMRIAQTPRANGRAIATNDDSCPICDPLNDDAGTGASATPVCDAGGTGASSCMYSSGSNACSITCDTKYYYACCRTTATGVKCSCEWAINR
jgi:hypothetical protein